MSEKYIRKRPERIMLTLTAEEKRRIEYLAERAELPVTIYCRKVLLAQGRKVANDGEL